MDGLEYRDVRLIEVRATETTGSFSGYGAVFNNLDAYGDVIAEGAFGESLKEWEDRGKWPPMLLQHGGGFFGGSAMDMLPVGEWTEMGENKIGLKVDGRLFALGTERGQYTYEGLKSGVLDGLSIGFKTRQFVAGTKPGEPDRTITEIDLWEVSIVTFPANPKARVTGVKSLSIEELRDLELFLRRDGGVSQAAAVKAASACKRWLQRDVGAPTSTPRDEALPDDLCEILDSLERNEAFLIREALRR